MDITFLKEYIVFAKTLNYAKAAGESFISQPTLRSHIRALESEIGGDLVTKKNDRLTLTPAGRHFLKKARDVVAVADEMVEECQSLAEKSASLLISFLECAWIEDLFVKARDNYCASHPESILELLFSNKMHSNAESIASGAVDITVYPIVRLPGKEDETSAPDLPDFVKSIYIGPQNCLFWMSGRNPLFEKERLVASDLEGMTLVLGNTSNMNNAGPHYTEYFSERNVRIEVDNQPFSSYIDYFLSNTVDSFGIILEGHRFQNQDREGFRVFSLEDLDTVSDLYIIYDESRLNQQELDYVAELEKLAEEHRRALNV